MTEPSVPLISIE
jgi:adenylate cyclase